MITLNKFLTTTLMHYSLRENEWLKKKQKPKRPYQIHTDQPTLTDAQDMYTVLVISLMIPQ